MATFALITEGITDQATLESILAGHYGVEHDIRQVQPPRDQTDENRQGGFAGWERVIDFCSLDNFSDIFSTNDYVIIQIDTDICEHENIRISLTNNGKDIACSELVKNVQNFITSKISREIFEMCCDRIFFAISVHSLECWLLSAISNGNTKREKNCEHHLQRALAKNKEKLEKTYVCYQKISSILDRRKNLVSTSNASESLKIFLDSLPVIDE